MQTTKRRAEMSDNITNSPQIRFAGFTDAWEQRKLGEMLEERNEQIPENDEYPLMSFVQGAGVSPKGDRYDRSFLVKADNKKYKKTELGDFIYSSNNLETGSIGFNRTGNAVISPVYSIFSSKSELESRFIGILSTRKDFIAKMVRFRQGVVYGQWRIHEKDFLDIKITVPRHEEQKEIIDFYLNLDNLITLHQRKYDKLVIVKKSMLEKMFPKEGANVPEIRFAKFTDAWEQRKLGEHAIIKGRLGWKSLKQEEYTNEGPCMIAGKHISNGIIDWSKVDHIPQWRYDESPEIMLQNGDVIFSKDGSLGNPALIENLEGEATINSTMMLVRTDETINSNFFYQVLTSDIFQRLIYLKVSGSSIPHLFQADMNEFKFMTPTVEEQTKMGSFFKEFDNLITLHQRELNSLKNLKKSLLQQMFI